MRWYLNVVIIAARVISPRLLASPPAEGPDCWEPHLRFDIEGKGLMISLAFISGYNYSVSEANRILSLQGKDNYFCKGEAISSKEMIEWLNARLAGIVSAEVVARERSEALATQYPCK